MKQFLGEKNYRRGFGRFKGMPASA